MPPASAVQLFDNVVGDDVLNLFEHGNPRAEKVIDLLKYKKADVAAATDIPVSSIRYDTRMPEELRARMVEWAIVINLVAAFFEDETKTILWLQTRNPLLGGMSPRDMIRAGRFKKLEKFVQTALAENAP